jgi:hypothetical protein
VVFGVVTTCSFAGGNQCFGGICCLHLQFYQRIDTAPQPRRSTDLLFSAVKSSSPLKQPKGISLPVLHLGVHMNSTVLWAATPCSSEKVELAACICLFLASLLFDSEYVPPKRRTFSELHGVTMKKTAVRTSIQHGIPYFPN